MSILIDDLVSVFRPGNCTYRRVGTLKYIAKPCSFYGLSTIIRRLKDAYRILIGKSCAYHYWEDENN